MSLNKHLPLIILLLLPYFTMTSSLSASNFDNDILSQIKLLSPVQTIDTLIQLSSESFNQDKFQESIGLLQEALIMAEKHPKKYKYYLILYKIGKSHYRNNNYNLAQEYLFKCLENTQSGISLSIKGNVYSVIASTYYNLGDYSLAHEYKLKSIELKEIEKDSVGISGDYYDLGSMFFYENLYEKALEYYNKAKKLALKTGHTRIVYNSTAALGATFERMGDLELSLKLNMVMGRKTQLYQVFQNLIMNALKYNINEKPYILVECIKNCENYIFAVRDNGIGIEEKGQKKIFEMFQRLHSKEEFEGSGIGLAICKKIIDAHDGDIWVESQKGKGSTFFFSLPFHGYVMKDEADSFPKLVSLEN